MSVRLTLALEAGLTLPDGTVAVLHPPADADLSALDPARTVIVSPSRVVHDRFAPRWTCATEMPEAAATIVFATRAKDLARDLIARAQGLVVLDGAKTDGIDSLIKAVRARGDIHGPISKAHGKVIWFQGGGFDDWRVAPGLVDGFHTAPGVFSADGVDPASRLLADTLPERLGRSVADLGAGWGYLSREILRRDSVQSLHMVEADATALTCARQNVTDPRARAHWADATRWEMPELLDCVVTNPPFHTGRAADPALGRAFLATAARALRPTGELWLVANRHLAYEEYLRGLFRSAEEVAGDNRFKVIHATRPNRVR